MAKAQSAKSSLSWRSPSGSLSSSKNIHLAPELSSGRISGKSGLSSGLVYNANNIKYSEDNSLSNSAIEQNSMAFDAYYDRILQDNQNSAKAQMDFQREMSNTAHQREVKDLIAAGLNPVLSANNGASSPSGAYSAVDGSPLTAKENNRLQKELMNQQLKNQLKINQQSLDNQYKIAELQAKVQKQINKDTNIANAAMNKYSVDKGYDASINAASLGYASSIYGANQSAAASRYASENSLLAAQTSAAASRYASDVGSKNISISIPGFSFSGNYNQLEEAIKKLPKDIQSKVWNEYNSKYGNGSSAR